MQERQLAETALAQAYTGVEEQVEVMNRVSVDPTLLAADCQIRRPPPDRQIRREHSWIYRVFEPLFSTKSFGVGLGLPIVKGIMEQHGGGIEISGQKDVGTTVVLWLPLSNDEDRKKSRTDEKDSQG